MQKQDYKNFSGVQKQSKHLRLFRTAIGLLTWSVLCASLVSVVLLCTIALFNWPIQGRFGVVKSGSMEPNIPIGSLLWLKARASYTHSDVVAFTHPDSLTPQADPAQNNLAAHYKNVSTKNNLNTSSKIIALHRILEEKDDYFITKGDANATTDPWKVKKSDVLGKVQFQIPYLGYFISWLQTQAGILTTVVLPLSILLTHSLRTYFESKFPKKPNNNQNQL